MFIPRRVVFALSTTTPYVLFYCRPGLENDCAAEVMEKSSRTDVFGYVKTNEQSGYVRFFPHDANQALELVQRLPFSDWVFPRQCVWVNAELTELPLQDRVSAILEAASQWPEITCLWQEYPDTNEGKQITRLTKKLAAPLEKGLRAQGTLKSSQCEMRGHLFWLSGNHVVLGLSVVANSAPWIMGYPRLRFPRQAPSRSTLKLEEAWLQLLPPQQADSYLKPGFRAVDLGASPGGWTWQLVNKGLKVYAVDNGPMDPGLMAAWPVTHLREDAFTYKPRHNVEWMVCDIVDKPARVAGLMVKWLTNGWCRRSIFNLKLPMKRRWQTSNELLLHIREELAATGLSYQLRAKQLYHDREEITVFVNLD